GQPAGSHHDHGCPGRPGGVDDLVRDGARDWDAHVARRRDTTVLEVSYHLVDERGTGTVVDQARIHVQGPGRGDLLDVEDRDVGTELLGDLRRQRRLPPRVLRAVDGKQLPFDHRLPLLLQLPPERTGPAGPEGPP